MVPEAAEPRNGCARLSSPGATPARLRRLGCRHSSRNKKAVLAVLRCAPALQASPLGTGLDGADLIGCAPLSTRLSVPLSFRGCSRVESGRGLTHLRVNTRSARSRAPALDQLGLRRARQPDEPLPRHPPLRRGVRGAFRRQGRHGAVDQLPNSRQAADRAPSNCRKRRCFAITPGPTRGSIRLSAALGWLSCNTGNLGQGLPSQ